MTFAYVPPDGYRNTTSFPTKPSSEAEFRDSMQDLLDQIRDYINNPDGLTLTNTGDVAIVLNNIAIAATSYRLKSIINTANVTNDAWLFRSKRPSDNAEIDYTLGGPGGNIWHGGNSPASLATNGYQKLGSGGIYQWGTFTLAAGASTTVSFPLAFNAACTPQVVGSTMAAAADISIQDSVTNTNFSATNVNNGVRRLRWVAFGWV